MSEEKFDNLEEEELDDLVYLTDEDGNEVAFEYLDTIDYQGNLYAVLIAADEEEDEVQILQLEGDPEEEDEVGSFLVEDEAVAQAVFDIFRERNKDIYNFAD